MVDRFEDHCWKDVIPDGDLQVYTRFRRETFVGPRPAVIVVDCYDLVYRGGPLPVSEVAPRFPYSCGINAWNAIAPTRTLLTAARRAGLPIFYSKGNAVGEAQPRPVRPTNSMNSIPTAADFEIHKDLAPAPGDVVIVKQRASVFFGTPLTAHLTQLGVSSVIVVGETTSGCVRATAVDAFSHGYHVSIVEECVFDRSDITHKVNLFDLHHKYADVMSLAEVVRHLDGLPAAK